MTLIRRLWVGDLELTDYPYGLQFGADLGSPDGEVVTLESLLADGQIESLVRRLNRGMTIPILVEGADLKEVQDNEAALVRECDRRMNTLTLDLGDGFADLMVFETTTIEPVRVTGSGSDELDAANLHSWSLAVRALPFWRTDTLIVDDAGTPPSSGGTLLDSCESTTGWSLIGGSGGTYSVDSVVFTEGTGSIKALAGSVTTYESAGVAIAGNGDEFTGLAIDTDTGGYLSVAVRWQWTDTAFGFTAPGLYAAWMQVDGVWTAASTPVAVSREDDGFVHYVWPVDADLTVTGLRFGVTQHRYATFPDNPYVWYDDIELLPSATTDHQIVKQIDVQGSARTVGSLRIAAPSESVALGQVFVEAVSVVEVPAGHQPDGRRWITQGTTSADATTLHGSYLTPNSTYSSAAGYPIFDIPAAMLSTGRPSTPWTVVALVLAESSDLTFGVQGRLRMDTTDVGPTSEAEITLHGLTTGWQFISVGTVYLPPQPLQGIADTTKVRLLFKGAKFADVFLVPAWETGGRPVADLSIVDCGTGTVESGGASSSVWFDSPAPANEGLGAVYRGPTADRTNVISAFGTDLKTGGIHNFAPGPLLVFVVSTGAAGPTVTIYYYPRWL